MYIYSSHKKIKSSLGTMTVLVQLIPCHVAMSVTLPNRMLLIGVILLPPFITWLIPSLNLRFLILTSEIESTYLSIRNFLIILKIHPCHCRKLRSILNILSFISLKLIKLIYSIKFIKFIIQLILNGVGTKYIKEMMSNIDIKTKTNKPKLVEKINIIKKL